MSFRAVHIALIPAILAGALLAGCGQSALTPGMAKATQSGLRAKSVTDVAPFLASAQQAIAMVNQDPGFRNAVLVSIEGHGLDKDGKLVPLLGGNWTFKFWANKVEDSRMATEFSLVTVIHHVEGHDELIDDGEAKQTKLTRALDPSKLSPPTEIVPFAIRLGLKVNPAGPQFNFYDVTYNSFYANPSMADTNVADVTSFYQRDTFDGLHIPADAGLLPKPAAPNAAPAPLPPATKAKIKQMSPMEIAKDEAGRQNNNGRQHN